ncbi:hypothetical protein [Sorangium sp. So ce388]|uniref:hypothetical protein n=1 Tax=Sorangium sp. So ce388 TaxID=3133309 RepID=UPI003F5BB191
MWRYPDRRQTAIWNGRVRGVEQGAIRLFAPSCIIMMSCPAGTSRELDEEGFPVCALDAN